jgi:YesN/AraC family two-component response regulator
MTITVLLVDDQQLLRSGFRMVLDAHDGIEVVGEASNGDDAIQKTAELLPDVVIMDVRMPGTGRCGHTCDHRALPELSGTHLDHIRP